MSDFADAVVAAHVSAYDDWAETFAERTAEMPPELVSLGEQVLARFDSPPRVLDVGCGPGRDMAWFEERGATVVGVDISPRMLELAGERCEGALAQMDMRRLRFPAAAFDLVWSIASLLHLPKGDALRALAEFRRVVDPRGLTAVALKRGSGEQWEKVGEAPRRLFARYEPDELAATLDAAGFAVETVECVTSTRGEDWLHAIAAPI